jgi:hypothetical protein
MTHAYYFGLSISDDYAGERHALYAPGMIRQSCVAHERMSCELLSLWQLMPREVGSLAHGPTNGSGWIEGWTWLALQNSWSKHKRSKPAIAAFFLEGEHSLLEMRVAAKLNFPEVWSRVERAQKELAK